MKLITSQSPISRTELKQLASEMFGNLVKAVVDVNKGVMVVQAELHSDEEAYLMQNDSNQANLWGINLYPDMEDQDFVEFDSMINLRPSQDNMSRGVDDPEIQSKIRKIVTLLVS